MCTQIWDYKQVLLCGPGTQENKCYFEKIKSTQGIWGRTASKSAVNPTSPLSEFPCHPPSPTSFISLCLIDNELFIKLYAYPVLQSNNPFFMWWRKANYADEQDKHYLGLCFQKK